MLRGGRGLIVVGGVGAHHRQGVRRVDADAAPMTIVTVVGELGGQRSLRVGIVVLAREGRGRRVGGRWPRRVAMTEMAVTSVVDVVGYGPADAGGVDPFAPPGDRGGRRGQGVRGGTRPRLPPVHGTLVGAASSLAVLGLAVSFGDVRTPILLVVAGPARLLNDVVAADLAYHAPDGAGGDGRRRPDGDDVARSTFGRGHRRRGRPPRAESGRAEAGVLGGVDLAVLELMGGLYHLLEDGEGRRAARVARARGVAGAGGG